MIGQIEKYSNDSPLTGVIVSDGVLYDFNVKVWRSRFAPEVGQTVEFDLKNGQVTRVKIQKVYPEHLKPVKSKLIAGLLGIFLGAVGAHRLYLGFYGIAIAQLALTVATLGFGVLWGFVEGCLILLDRIDKDAKGRDLK